MALKTLMLKRSIDMKKAELEALRAKDEDFAAREAELEASIGEADTDEQQEVVSEEIDKFETEQKAHQEAKSVLAAEIQGLEAELEDVEKNIPVCANPVPSQTIYERNECPMMNIRSLPMSQRAFDALPMERRQSIVKQDDVQNFFTQLRSAGKSQRAISGGELTIPIVFLDLIAENMYRYSKLLNRVRVRNVTGEARQTIAGTVPEAIWTEMCGAINELSFIFNQVTLDGYKVAGYVPVCNSLLEDSDIELASWIVEMISESLGYAKDKAILYGKGAASKMPLGIMTRLAQTAKPSDYPANAPEWIDLHTSNVITIEEELTGAAFWSALTVAAGNTFSPYSRGTQFWAMNSKTYARLKSKVITFTATGDIAAGIYGTLPIITGDVDILEFIPDGDIIGGYGDLYLWAERAGMQIELSRDVQFIQDNTVFRGKERADGMPIVPNAFVAININGASPTTAMSFAGDTANAAQLSTLMVGNETLSPSFNTNTYAYTIAASGTNAKVEATPAQPGASVAIAYNGANVRNGGTVTWVADSTVHPLTITVRNGNAVVVYTVNVTKAAG